MYRFQRFDLAQVPAKNRGQALRLELAQWTPFANSDYYIGWHGDHALVWAWDADKVQHAIASHGFKPHKAHILPESLLQTPVEDGLCLSRCHEGFEGQLWRDARLERSRWWPQSPTSDEWLMFQRDAGIPPAEQQGQPPAPRLSPLNARPWINQAGFTAGQEMQLERLIIALSVLVLSMPTFWYGFSLYKLQLATAQMRDQQSQLQQQAEPIMQARGQAQDYLMRINALQAIDPYPGQLSLMAKIAQVLPQDKSYIQDWDYQSGQLKITLTSASDISTTFLIGVLQKAGPFRDVKALPGRDPKSVTFQMEVTGG